MAAIHGMLLKDFDGTIVADGEGEGRGNGIYWTMWGGWGVMAKSDVVKNHKEEGR